MEVSVNDFAQSLIRLKVEPSSRVVLAVSGGSDSVALALLSKSYFGPANIRACVIDHGFRSNSAEEAAYVTDLLKSRGIASVLTKIDWSGTPPKLNRMQVESRERRFEIFARQCQEFDATTLLTGHHKGDQLETFFLRLGMSSGLDGLCGMRPSIPFPFRFPFMTHTLTVVRPLLRFDKAQLQATCRAEGVQWVEDPSNVNLLFKRNQIRNAINQLSQSGQLDIERISKLQAHTTFHVSVARIAVTSLISKYVRSNGTHRYALFRSSFGWNRQISFATRLLIAVVGWVGASSSVLKSESIDHAITELQKPRELAAGFSIGLCSLKPLPPRLQPPELEDTKWIVARELPQKLQRKHQPVSVELHLGRRVCWDNRFWITQMRPATTTFLVVAAFELGDDPAKIMPSKVYQGWLELPPLVRPCEPVIVARTQRHKHLDSTEEVAYSFVAAPTINPTEMFVISPTIPSVQAWCDQHWQTNKI